MKSITLLFLVFTVPVGVSCRTTGSDGPSRVKSIGSNSPYLGKYEDYGVYSFFDYAEVTLQNGGDPRLDIGWDPDSLDHWFDILERDGSYYFDDEIDDECDDPGCGYLIHGSGELLIENGRPAIIGTLTLRYDYPEYDGDIEGDVEENFHLVRTGALIDQTPLFANMQMDRETKTVLNRCYRAKSRYPEITCVSARKYKFTQRITEEIVEEFRRDEFSSPGNQLIESTFETASDFFDKLYELQDAKLRAVALHTRSAVGYRLLSEAPEKLKSLMQRKYEKFYVIKPYSFNSQWDKVRVVAVNDHNRTLLVFEWGG
jgi:hypothetical protein